MAKWNCSCCAVGPDFHPKTTVKTGLRVFKGEGIPHRTNRPISILTNLCLGDAGTFRGGSTDLPNVADGENRGHIVLRNTMRQSGIGSLQYSQPVSDDDDFNMDFEAEKDILLGKLLPKSSRKARLVYAYEFGDGWRR